MSGHVRLGTIPVTADNALKAEAILWLTCATGDREARADLAAIVLRGLGHVPISEPKYRCSACGSKAAPDYRPKLWTDTARP
jgi:hypothetical protein